MVKQNPNIALAHALKMADLTLTQAYVISRHIEGLRQREIAAELGITRQAIGRHLKAGIAKLKATKSRLLV